MAPKKPDEQASTKKASNRKDSIDKRAKKYDPIDHAQQGENLINTYLIELLIFAIFSIICYMLIVFQFDNTLEGTPTYQVSLYQNRTHSKGGKHHMSESSDYELIQKAYAKNHLQIIINRKSYAKRHFEIPLTYPFTDKEFNPQEIDIDDPGMEMRLLDGYTTFPAFILLRKNPEDALLNFQIIPDRQMEFIYEPHNLKYEIDLPTRTVYGFGERIFQLQLKPGKYTVWPRNQPFLLEVAWSGYQGSGYQPVFLAKEYKSEQFYLVLVQTTTPIEIEFFYISTYQSRMTFHVVGGGFNLHVMTGGRDPQELLKQYHEFIGKSAIPPFWGLGYHQSRWGYYDLDMIEDVLKKFEEHNLPVDSIFSNIDYMKEMTTFTVDDNKFPQERTREVFNRYNKRWILILDPCISSQDSPQNIAWHSGVEKNVFLHDAQGKLLQGKMYPQAICHFPDFSHPNTSQWWADNVHELFKITKFDGLWLDLNEPTNFCQGQCDQELLKEKASDMQRYWDLIYTPGFHPLNMNAISLDDPHYNGKDELYMKTLFSLWQSQSTYEFMKERTSLPFLLSKGSFPGSGKFVGHWLGDQTQTWKSLKYQISTVMTFGIFGIPFVGGDICGLTDAKEVNGTEYLELVVRWYQAGLLFPLSKNNHQWDQQKVEPYQFEEPYYEGIKKAILLKYSILKYYYLQFVLNNGTGSVIKPLFFVFPLEKRLYDIEHQNVNEQFMIGDYVMVAPILENGANSREVYFPEAAWHHMVTGEYVNREGLDGIGRAKGKINDYVPIFQRGGHISHIQDITNVTSSEKLGNVFELLITFEFARNGNYIASGKILNIGNYQEDQIHKYCIAQNCVLDLQAKMIWDKIEQKFYLEVYAFGDSLEDEEGEIQLSAIRFVGLRDLLPFKKNVKKLFDTKTRKEVNFVLEYQKSWMRITFPEKLVTKRFSLQIANKI